MITFDWETIYLTCFGVGLVLSLLAFFSGFGHLHFGHIRLHMGHHDGAHRGASLSAGAHHAGQMSPLNGFTIVAFLCWFGGTGYLLHHGSPYSNALVLLRACDLVVLYDRDLASAEGQAWDIGDAVPLLSQMEIVPTDEYDNLAGSDRLIGSLM